MVTRIGGVEAVRGRDFIDPNKGKLSGSQILLEEDIANVSRTPRPKKSMPMYDIGKGMEKTVRDN